MNKPSLLPILTCLLFAAPPSFAGTDDTLPDFNKAAHEAGVPPSVSCDPAPQGATAVRVEDPAERWNKAGFTNAKVETWSDKILYSDGLPKDVQFTHGMNITAVLFRGANWSKDEIQQRYQRVSKILSQCGIKIQKVDLVESDAFSGWIDVDGMSRSMFWFHDKEKEITKALPITERPVFFYVRSSDDGTDAYSQPEYWVRNGPTLNTIWMTSTIKKLKDSVPASNYAEAHELGHTLMNMGHVHNDKANIMNMAEGLTNDKFTQEQCEDMRKSKLVRPL